MTSSEKAQLVAGILKNKKASDIVVLDISQQTIIADYFVIATGNSTTQIKAFSGLIEDKMKEAGEPPLRIEGYDTATWVLIDLGGVVVHIYSKEAREFYSIERLWADGVKLE